MIDFMSTEKWSKCLLWDMGILKVVFRTIKCLSERVGLLKRALKELTL